MQKLVASATVAHLRMIEHLTGRIARLEEGLAVKARQVRRLELTVKALNKELNEAREQTRLAREAHLAHILKNSQTSSLPPSTDTHKRTRSLREGSGRKPGGQVGHKGMTKEMVEKPDHLVVHVPETCSLCGSSLVECVVEGSERRQVHDLPPLKVGVVEHQAQTKVCDRCGTKNKAKFPKDVSAPVQYGEGVRAVAAYLMGYQLLPCQHRLCNAHILRELNYVIETSKASWAQEMKTLLLDIKAAVDQAVEAGKKRLAVQQETEFLGRYERIVSEAGKLYEPLKRKKYRAKTRRPRESPITAAARKLANRLSAKRDQILLFMRDFRVPFDNNQAERDLRMLKVKQKISGCFRTEKGAEEFCRLRSYISTMKKQGHSVMETIRSVFAGKTTMPALRC